ncbi:hypothetical protein [Nonomuraea sp. NPDC049784]|uniref:hypothetical protein n=1 Tax=Nonomuraea sp. NPDC049784 TaxID=3154361 RepID=UPI0033D92619
MHTETHPNGATHDKPLRDTRGFWRLLLAMIAPLPMLAKAVYYLLSPVDGGAEFADTVTAYTADQQLASALRWFDAVFVVGLIPATIAVAWVARRGAPRLTTVGAVIALLGELTGFALLRGSDGLAYITMQQGFDVAATAKLADAIENDALQLVASLLFIVGIVIGLALLGIALWRSHVAPAWMGIGLALGAFTHPFVPGHLAQGIGLAAAAIGFAGASLALLRMRNDQFDLPPARLDS